MYTLKKILRYIAITFKYLSLLIASLIALLPMATAIITAFKSKEEYETTNVMTLPKSWLYFENFKVAFEKANMVVGFRNSLIILIFVLGGAIMFGTMLAYILSRFKFHGNELIRTLFLFAALIPGIATQVTVYQIMYSLNLINTLYGYIILMTGVDVISIYIFLQFFENIPVSLDESAVMDGASYFTVFFRILFPLLKPAIVTVLILKGVGTYNEYYMANLYLQDKSIYNTVATSLYTFTGPYGSQYNYITAGVIITMIPAVIIFIVGQKQIYSGLTQGAVKG
ncbi:MAG: carbohydrate ABC transporter permease [Mobilitalea sp.]